MFFMAAAFPMPRESSPRRLPAAEALRAAGISGWFAVCVRRRARLGRREGRQSAPKGSRFLINGEPTDNRLALASKGALRAVFRATGTMAHSAYPELGESAVHKLVQAWASCWRSICRDSKTSAQAR